MDHIVREPTGSIIDIAALTALSASTPEAPGINAIRATVAAIDPETGEASYLAATEHTWLRDQAETERDFLTRALAQARALGIVAVRVEGVLAVTPSNVTPFRRPAGDGAA